MIYVSQTKPAQMCDDETARRLETAKEFLVQKYSVQSGTHDDPAARRVDFLFNEAARAIAELARLRDDRSEVDALAHVIALEDCESVLEGEALIKNEDNVEWWDMGDEASFPERTDPSRRYLELRGLLVCHPIHPNWIRVLEEPEPRD